MKDHSKSVEALINELKKGIFSAVADMVLIQHRKEELQLEWTLSKNSKSTISRLLKKHKEQPKSEIRGILKHALSEIENCSKDLQALVKHHHGPGKKRTYPVLAIEVLRAIDVCEHHDISMEWIRLLFRPKGELDLYSKQFYNFKLEISFPVPSRTSGKDWIYKFKETLQRSYFSSQGKVEKKKSKAYEDARAEFYEDLRKHSQYYKPLRQ